MDIELDNIDHLDFRTLLAAIFRQAIDDYIKLQHPKHRKKKYLTEAFQNAVDMFFDEEYRLLKLQNEDGDDMSLEDMIEIITDDHQASVEQVKKYIIDESVKFWDDKPIHTLTVPDNIVFNGYVYTIQHTDEPGYTIDYDSRIVTMNRRPTFENEKTLVDAAMEIMFYHDDIAMSKSKRDKLATSWFRALKVNNCFKGAN